MNNNKNNFNKIVLTAIIVIISLIIFANLSWYETHYTRIVEVMNVYDNAIVVKDEYNNHWTFKEDGFKIGDILKITINTMHTDNNEKDDIIEKVNVIYNK